MMIYLILLFAILFFLLAWRRLDWAVMFLIAALPAYLIRFDILGLPATLLEVMIWTVFLVWFFKNYKIIFERVKLRVTSYGLRAVIRYPFDWEIVLMLLVALVAAGVAGFSASSFGIWKAYFFEPALFFIVALNVMHGAKGREKILWSLAISALAVSALAIYQKFTGALIDNPVWAAIETRRVVSFFGYPNAIGLYLGPIVLVMIGWLTSVIARSQVLLATWQSLVRFRVCEIASLPSVARNDKLKAIFVSLTIILSVLSIYFAKSKGALMGVAAGLIVFGLLAGKKIRWAAVAVALVAAVVIAAYQPARNSAVRNLTLTNLSGQIRKAGWTDAWNMLKDGRIITGAGLANFQQAVAPYHQPGLFFNKDNDPDFRRKIVLFNNEYKKKFWQPLEIYLYPHNIVLNFWSELGLAGMLLFVWVILKYFWMGISALSLRGSASDRSNLTNEKFLIIGFIGAMVVIVVHGLVDVPYFKNDLAVMFWLLLAMMSLIKLESVNK
ncbi:MAG: O-antigen ligase family protein [bacterium]|nr:O-antigen ligase family protein [bacterium]